MHSLKDCPLRSMAWLTVNQDDIVTHATDEMKELLDFDPTNQPISTIWQPLNSNPDFVSTVSQHTLSICTHMNNHNNKTIVCTDITDLKNHMFTNSTEITRLTMYGTIEATWSPTHVTEYCIGQPMMRYIHSEDVQLFCKGLNQATKSNSIAHFQIRLLTNNNNNDDSWAQFTVMLLQDQRVLCFIQPIQEQETPVTRFYQCSDLLKSSLGTIQTKFWYAIEHGMNVLAKHLYSSLIALFQTIWCIWYNSNDDDQLIRNWVQSTKSSKQVDTLCHFVSYLGISHNTTKSLLDLTLDQTSEWFLKKSSTVYDHIL